MFDHTFVDGMGKTNRSWTVAVSFALESLAAGVMILIPLVWTEALPRTTQISMLTTPAPPPPPAPPPQPMHTVVKKAARRQFLERRLQVVAPQAIPMHAAVLDDDQPALSASAVVGGLEVGVDLAGVGIPGPAIIRPPPPLPAPAASPAKEAPIKPAEPVRQSSVLQAAKCVNCPKPVYPPIARQARIQGAVVLSAIIAKDGTVKKLAVVTSASPLLTPAALDAVKRWVYSPMILNREAVEVSTEITINFALQ